MIEEYENGIEELKSSNEELVSVNEEMQSTNGREIEPLKRSFSRSTRNLHTVNKSANNKVDALDRAN